MLLTALEMQGKRDAILHIVLCFCVVTRSSRNLLEAACFCGLFNFHALKGHLHPKRFKKTSAFRRIGKRLQYEPNGDPARIFTEEDAPIPGQNPARNFCRNIFCHGRRSHEEHDMDFQLPPR